MKPTLVGSGLVAGALLNALLLLGASGQNAQVGSTAPAAATPELKQSDSVQTIAAPFRRDEMKPERNASGKIKLSTGIDEILKMVQAGVSAEVIKTYIENSTITYSLTATDIIALKEHVVPDDLTTALIRRGAMLRMQAGQGSNLNAPTPAHPGSNRSYANLDPESYDYFQYYYLYPRTLAAANQRLFSPYASFSDVAPYGIYGPMPFHPLPPSLFRRP